MKNRKFISKTRRSKVTDYAALTVNVESAEKSPQPASHLGLLFAKVTFKGLSVYKGFSSYTKNKTFIDYEQEFLHTPINPRNYEEKTREHLTISQVSINKNFQRKIVNIFLPINFNICLGCSKEPSN